MALNRSQPSEKACYRGQKRIEGVGWIDTSGLFGLEMLRSQTKVALTAGGSEFFSKHLSSKKVTGGLLNGKEAGKHPPKRDCDQTDR